MTIKRLTSIEFGIGFLRADGYEETAALMEAQLAALQQRITKLEEALRATTAELAVQIALQLGADNIEIIREKHPLIVAARALLEEKE